VLWWIAVRADSALLDGGGDRLVRSGLHAPFAIPKLLFLLSGGVVLFAYGYLVKTPPRDFGCLLSVYVVFYFVIAQAISSLEAHRWPSVPVRRRLHRHRRPNHRLCRQVKNPPALQEKIHLSR
jgi:small multidrug resistance family-3 protein